MKILRRGEKTPAISRPLAIAQTAAGLGRRRAEPPHRKCVCGTEAQADPGGPVTLTLLSRRHGWRSQFRQGGTSELEARLRGERPPPPRQHGWAPRNHDAHHGQARNWRQASARIPQRKKKPHTETRLNHARHRTEHTQFNNPLLRTQCPRQKTTSDLPKIKAPQLAIDGNVFFHRRKSTAHMLWQVQECTKANNPRSLLRPGALGTAVATAPSTQRLLDEKLWMSHATSATEPACAAPGTAPPRRTICSCLPGLGLPGRLSCLTEPLQHPPVRGGPYIENFPTRSVPRKAHRNCPLEPI
jgi:hypothetical protein